MAFPITRDEYREVTAPRHPAPATLRWALARLGVDVPTDLWAAAYAAAAAAEQKDAANGR